MNIDPPFAISCHRQGEQRRRERCHDRSPEAEPAIDPAAGDEGIREQEELISEQTTERQAHRPNMPTSVLFGVAPEVLYRQ
jgi:hypothetical protein